MALGFPTWHFWNKNCLFRLLSSIVSRSIFNECTTTITKNHFKH